MQFVMMRIWIFRFFMMNYLPLLIIWTSISHVALMESMQSILNLVPMLTDLSSFFTHGSLPDSMIANVLVPVIKSKTGHIMFKELRTQNSEQFI